MNAIRSVLRRTLVYCHYPDDFLILLLHMESSKVVYLLLWVISLFLISAYLVTVAYIDDQMQKKLKQLGLDLKEGHDYLVQDLPSRLNNNLQSIITAAKEINYENIFLVLYRTSNVSVPMWSPLLY